MLSVGLSGNRFSGKDKISKLFKQILVPVFNADAVLKFMLKFDQKLLGQMKLDLGQEYYKDGILNFNFISNSSKFEKVLDYLEPEILKLYESFQKKNEGNVYTLFHYSLLFERDIHKKMDKNICIFAPKTLRISRSMFMTGNGHTKVSNLANTEMDELQKNQMANFVVHNYEYGDVYDSVCKIDKQLVDLYLNSKKNDSYLQKSH